MGKAIAKQKECTNMLKTPKKLIKTFLLCLRGNIDKVNSPYIKDSKNLSNEEKVIEVLKYTTTDKKAYSAEEYSVGYHTIELNGQKIRGQRDMSIRFENIKYDFNNKNVLDIGCNQGGMLMHIHNEIQNGYGIDYNPKLINGANRLKDYKDYKNLNFYVFNLEEENLNLIKNFYSEKIDIVFLLSICMWIDNWKDVISFASSIAQDMLFESNGTESQQFEQIEFLKKVYKSVNLIDNFSRDDFQKNRQLLLCEN